MGAGEKGYKGSIVTQGSQARSTRMEPLDGGALLPSGEHTAVFHPCSIQERRWAKTAGGRLGEELLRWRRQSAILAPLEVSVP